MEAFECGGKWWLPGQEGQAVAGTLKVSPSGGMKLQLLGALGPPLRTEKRHSIILGTVDQSPLGNEVTLTGTFLTGATLGSFLDSREAYHVAKGYFGALLPEESAFAFRSMRLRLGGLSEWIHTQSGLKRQPSPLGEVGETVPLGLYTQREPVTAIVLGSTISLGYGLSASFSATECRFREEAQVKVTCETPISADDFNALYGYPLRSLMSFVCDRAQTISHFSVYRAEVPHDEILVVGELVQPEVADAEDDVSWQEMLFTLKDVDFSVFFKRWVTLTREYSAACNVYFGLMFGPPAFVDLTFQTVANAVQMYHARHGDGVAMRTRGEQRLKEILAGLSPANREWVVDHLGASPYPPFQAVLRSLLDRQGFNIDPLIGGRRDRFVDEATGTLEYILRREAEAEPAASYGADLYWLTQKLRFLLKACFMHEAGLSAEKIRECFSRNPLYQHIYTLELGREAALSRESRGSGQEARPEATASGQLKGSPEFEEFWDYLKGESARRRAIVIGTYFDDRLGQMLGSSDESFHSKIETAHNKGLLTRNERDDLQSIRKLRQLIVHRLVDLEYDSEERAIITGLKSWQIATGARPEYERLLPTPEDKLLYVAAVIASRLKHRFSGGPPLPEPDLTDPQAWPSIRIG